MRRILLWLSYDGTEYCGFQQQPNGETIASVLNAALSRLSGGAAVSVLGASRTDSGVHSRAQACTFDLAGSIPTANIPLALRGLLPPAIVVWKAEEVPLDFQILRAACGKHYRYTVQQGPFADPFTNRFRFHFDEPLADEAMAAAAAQLVGEHDFRAFCAANSGRQNFVRQLDAILPRRQGNVLTFDFWGRGFLYRMVRSLTGYLLDVGAGRLAPSLGAELLQSGDRGALRFCAPPEGLCLEQVYFCEEDYQRDKEASIHG